MSAADDAVSVADSILEHRIRRTEAERIQLLKDHPDCGEIEEHRVICKQCSKWVNLGRGTTYAIKPWEKHRARCDSKTRPQDEKYVSSCFKNLVH